MNVSAREVDDVLVLDFGGVLPDSDEDQANLRSQVAAAVPDKSQPRRLVFVLPQLSAITSRQLSLIVGCYVAAHRKLPTPPADDLRIVASAERVRKVFHFCGSSIRPYATLEEALRD